MYIRHFRFILIALFLLSCGNKEKYIHVFYYTGDFDTSIAITPTNALLDYLKTSPSDTIAIYDCMLADSINSLKLCSDDVKINIDVRMLILYENKMVFIASIFPKACDLSERPYHISDYLIFKIKEYSQYFNYWESDVLDCLSEIKKFGRPNNYKEINPFVGFPSSWKTKRHVVLKCY